MLTVSEAVRRRRSTRSFKLDPVPNEMILEMLEAARLAPSASNSQPWRYVVVTAAEEKRALRKLCLNQQFVEEAGVDFVVCADLRAYTRESYRKRREEAVEAGVFPSSLLNDPNYQRYIDSIDDSDLAKYITPATANTYIATEHILLTAAALGLGSCWVGAISDHKAIREMFGIPRDVLVLGVVAVGFTNIEPKARPHLPLVDILLRPFPGAE